MYKDFLRVSFLAFPLLTLSTLSSAESEIAALAETFMGQSSAMTAGEATSDQSLLAKYLQDANPINSTAASGIQGALNFKQPDQTTFRGDAEVNAFKMSSPAVVLILTESGSGTGSVISKNGLILTNWHVVGSAKYVDVVFRPSDTAKEVFSDSARRAEVLKVDQVADLALVKLISAVPNIPTLPFATERPDIGEDVIAIGHPHGLTWTLTKGIVTGLRESHAWQYNSGFQHSATVVQTQTPINPGNSGGPLLNSKLEILGVNSFGGAGTLTNFAVSAESVQSFLDMPESRYAPRIPGTLAMQEMLNDCKQMSVIGESWVSADRSYKIARVDLTCDGHPNGTIQTAIDGKEPVKLLLDTTGDGLIDVVLIDVNNDSKWNLSFYDVDADGVTDIVGYHGEESIPEQFVTYARFEKDMALAN